MLPQPPLLLQQVLPQPLLLLQQVLPQPLLLLQQVLPQPLLLLQPQEQGGHRTRLRHQSERRGIC